MKAIAILLLVSLCLKVSAQQCGNCKTTPKISGFDFDVQIPKPNAGDGTENLWPEWKNLFILAGSVASNIKNNEGNCVILNKPPSYDKKDAQLGSVGGETFTNLPSNPNISSDLSVYGDYLLTGSLSKSGSGYNMHVEIQSSCDRKVVATADVPFQLSAVVNNVNSIAQQAAAQLSPLIDKINKFEQQERKERTDFALGGSDLERVKITLLKKNLIAGQETDIDIALTDCDGAPLPNRTISFLKGIVGNAPMPGTIGGIVTPSKVTTDASGKAKAKFKLTAGAGQPAIINAHNLTGTSTNCKDAFIGSAQVDAMPSYKVTVTCMITGGSDFMGNIFGLKTYQNMKSEVAYSFSLVHNPAEQEKEGEQIMIMPEFENTPGFKGGKTVTLFNDGYSEHIMVDKQLEGKPEYDRYFSKSPLPPTVSFIINNNDLVFFAGGVEFPEPKEDESEKSKLSPVSGHISAAKDDKKYFPVKPKKVTDPNSPYKWVYEFQYNDASGQSSSNASSKQGSKGVESASIQIWKSF